MITLAITRPHSMVSDDYYKDGLSINWDLSKDDLAARLMLEAEFSYDQVLQTYHLTLTSQNGAKLNYGYLLVSLEHPTLPNQDNIIQLILKGDNVYSAQHTEALQGKRYITVMPPGTEWRLTGSAEFPLTSTHLSARQLKTDQN